MEIVGSLGGETRRRAIKFSTRRLHPLKGSADLNISLLNSFRFYDSSWGYCWVLQAYLLSRTAFVVFWVPWLLRFARRVVRFGRLSVECPYVLLFVITCFVFVWVSDARFLVNLGIVSKFVPAFCFCWLDLAWFVIAFAGSCPEFDLLSRICPGFWFFPPDFSRILISCSRIIPGFWFCLLDYSRIFPGLWEKLRRIEKIWKKLRKIERNWEKLIEIEN